MKKWMLAAVFFCGFVAAFLRLWSDTTDQAQSAPVQIEIQPTLKTKPRSSGAMSPSNPVVVVVAQRLEQVLPFSTLTRKTFEQLPREEEYQKAQANDADPEHTHPLILRPSEAFGQIGDRLQEDRSLVNDGAQFFRSCALDPKVVAPVRAVCLRNFRYWANRAEPRIAIDETEFAAPIKSLARALPAAR